MEPESIGARIRALASKHNRPTVVFEQQKPTEDEIEAFDTRARELAPALFALQLPYLEEAARNGYECARLMIPLGITPKDAAWGEALTKALLEELRDAELLAESKVAWFSFEQLKRSVAVITVALKEGPPSEDVQGLLL